MSRWQLFRNVTQNRCFARGAFWPIADIVQLRCGVRFRCSSGHRVTSASCPL